MNYRYVCYIDKENQIGFTTEKEPFVIEGYFKEKQIIKIKNVMYDFGKFTFIEVFETKYEIKDVEDGKPIKIEDIPIEERKRYLVNEPINLEQNE